MLDSKRAIDRPRRREVAQMDSDLDRLERANDWLQTTTRADLKRFCCVFQGFAWALPFRVCAIIGRCVGKCLKRLHQHGLLN